MSIGTNIKKRRFELRMSQQELANALGYKTRSTIAKIESGENDVTQKKLQRFAEVLDTTVEALISSNTTFTPIATSAPFSFPESNEENSRVKNIAVVLAGGKSSRNHQNIPNQFINILGKPVIVYCLEAYQAHPAIDDIYVVCLKGWEQIVTAYAQQFHITKLRGLIPAAASGILSVKNGLEYVEKKYSQDDTIIFQEATRPMVSIDMISKLLQACHENGSANICQSMKDHVQFRYVDGNPEYIDRDSVVDLQSPEAYKISIIDGIFKMAETKQHPLNESCCAMLLFNLGYGINFIEGAINNIKIVRQEDIAIATTLLRRTT
jgi:2-C-methyl-D-erythritol 4-phosphate cytidylyltransferase